MKKFKRRIKLTRKLSEVCEGLTDNYIDVNGSTDLNTTTFEFKSELNKEFDVVLSGIQTRIEIDFFGHSETLMVGMGTHSSKTIKISEENIEKIPKILEEVRKEERNFMEREKQRK